MTRGVKMADKMVQAKKQREKEDDGPNSEGTKRKTNDVSEGQGPKKSSSSAKRSSEKNTPTASSSKVGMASCSTLGSELNLTQTSRVESENGNDNAIMAMLKAIQENQKKQDDKINSLSDKVTDIMNDYDNYAYYDQDYIDDESQDNENQVEEPDVSENDEPPSKKQKTDKNNNATEKTSRFSTMAKRFKVKEVCDEKIDEVLAQNVTSLFLNGMDDTQYSELVDDEKNARPENCEGLRVVRTNQLVWDIIPHFTQTCDKKMQNIEKTVVKAANILVKTVNSMAKMEGDKDESEISEVIDSCNDSIALLGHANRQINLARREFMKPDLDSNYLHLCAQSVPYTDYLFGDDVSKAAKDIEDSRKIGNRLQGGYVRGRGSFRGGRGRGYRRGSRIRGGYRGSRAAGQGRGHNDDAKNHPKRGGSAPGRGYRH